MTSLLNHLPTLFLFVAVIVLFVLFFSSNAESLPPGSNISVQSLTTGKSLNTGDTIARGPIFAQQGLQVAGETTAAGLVFAQQGLQIGSTGSVQSTVQDGVFLYSPTTQLPPGGYQTSAFTWPKPFPSAPYVLCSLQQAGGAFWDQSQVVVQQTSATGMQVLIRNNSLNTTMGNTYIVYHAWV
jgi:hypothetical protein